ncbi:hypothetical protein [uncultured Vagococcus sp.]|uniref:hypothetical protein n=1 Tax=uncultured Vagococcus sp. TaxID=189676 RepID=UPI0028D48F31|nr:hypothetical protein [uncultured Vagococcus sp.]
MNKIKTGQCYLYRENGYESMVIDITLKKQIEHEALKDAFSLTIQRFDYLSCKLKEVAGDFYLEQNSLPFVIRNSPNHIPLGGKEANEHLIDVHFHDKTLYIDYHHGLCDGKGILPFVRSLLYHYISITTGEKLSINNNYTESSSYLLNETKEPGNLILSPLKHTQKEYTGVYSIPLASEQASRLTHSYRREVSIDSSSLLSFAKNHNATPAIAIAILFSEAIANTDNLTNSETVICNLAVDLRDGVGLNNTFKNCVSTAKLPYIASNQDSYEKLAENNRELIANFKKEENINYQLNTIISLSNHLDGIEGFTNKQQTLSIFNNLLSDTFILSYIGQMDLGDIDQYVHSVHTYSSGTRGLSIEMIALKEKFYLDIMQSFSNEKYIEAFLQLLKDNSINYDSLTLKKYSTPKDMLHNKSIL